TVALNAVPAVCALGLPVLPVPLPGEAVSPGTKICNFVNAPALTVINGLVFGLRTGVVMSEDVTVQLPAVFRVTLTVLVPASRAAVPGSVAFASVEVIPTVSVTVLTKFQFASTARTVTLKR